MPDGPVPTYFALVMTRPGDTSTLQPVIAALHEHPDTKVTYVRRFTARGESTMEALVRVLADDEPAARQLVLNLATKSTGCDFDDLRLDAEPMQEVQLSATVSTVAADPLRAALDHAAQYVTYTEGPAAHCAHEPIQFAADLEVVAGTEVAARRLVDQFVSALVPDQAEFTLEFLS